MPTVDALADDLARLAASLRAAGDVGLRRELTAAIKRAAEPVPRAIREGLKPHLPDRYAEVLDADLRLSVSVRTGQADPGVTIIAESSRTHRRKLADLNRGVLSHPLWGDRKHWYRQPVTPGFFTGPCEDAAPRAREEIEAALDRRWAQIWSVTHG